MKKILYLFIIVLTCACSSAPEQVTLTIMHTNDVHSQVVPLEPGGRRGGLGGYARLMGIVEQEREQDADLLLFDCGDFTQGLPYFNYFHGRVEVEAWNRMGYDAGCLGNHEFDYGVDTLAMMIREMDYPILCANYANIENSPLNGLVKPYVILERKGVRIGVIGLGVNPHELIAPSNFSPLEWQHPFPIANQIADELKNKHDCDLVICLSHMGTKNGEICDETLAANSRNIDIILGGHTHKLIVNKTITNLDGKKVVLSQMDKSGSHIGKMHVALLR